MLVFGMGQVEGLTVRLLVLIGFPSRVGFAFRRQSRRCGFELACLAVPTASSAPLAATATLPGTVLGTA